MRDQVISLGGSGENSRSCFLLIREQGPILLDCGVRREIHAPVSKVYPALTKDIAQSLQAVFLSHAHEDHTAALPYLYELGYRGPIYATEPTLAMVKGFLRKWTNYVLAGGGTLPFREENIDKLNLLPLKLGTNDVAGLPVTLGRSGHMLGSCWIQFDFDGKTVLYTGDLTYDGLLLQADPLPKADAVVMECAYAGRYLSQSKQYERLAQAVLRTIGIGGKVLLPVPSNGRGSDMLLYLRSLGVPICAEPAVVISAEKLRDSSEWLRPAPLWNADNSQLAVPKNAEERKRLALLPGGRVYMTPDGMLSSPTALDYFELLKQDPKNSIILSGHTALGTVGNRIFTEEYRAANNVQAQVERITIKVHPDEDDALALIAGCGAGKVMLFHAAKDSCNSLLGQLAARKITCCCGQGFKNCMML